MSAPTLRLLSLGAGVQSSALALMAADGTLPGLDGAIFADTGWEPKRVYRVVDELETVLTAAGIPLHRVSNGNLRDDAIDPAHRYASVPYFTLNWQHTREPIKSSGVECPACQGSGWQGGGLRDGLRARDWLDLHSDDDEVAELEAAANERGCAGCDAGNIASGVRPDKLAHTCYAGCDTCQVPGGTPGVLYRDWYPVKIRQEGMGRRQCTSEYKIAPINRKVRELLGAEPPHYRRVPRGKLVEQWIGFSADELHRVSDKEATATGTNAAGDMDEADAKRAAKRRGVSYVRKRYPLVELGMTRDDCERYLAERGWRHVAKSACIGCPFHGNRQWRDLRDNHPDEWADAVAFDAAIRKGGSAGTPLDGEAYLHPSRVPLPLAPIDRRTVKERRAAQMGIFDVLEDGDPDGCSPYGCRSGEPVA